MPNQINLPKNLLPLKELAYNMWFSWNPDARDLYKTIDWDLWKQVDRNPVAWLQQIDQEKIKTFSENKAFIKQVKQVHVRFRSYMEQPSTQFNNNYPNLTKQVTAYFSAEYGMHESLPNYAGGLGILSGDHHIGCLAVSHQDAGLGASYPACALLWYATFTTLWPTFHPDGSVTGCAGGAVGS